MCLMTSDCWAPFAVPHSMPRRKLWKAHHTRDPRWTAGHWACCSTRWSTALCPSMGPISSDWWSRSARVITTSQGNLREPPLSSGTCWPCVRGNGPVSSKSARTGGSTRTIMCPVWIWPRIWPIRPQCDWMSCFPLRQPQSPRISWWCHRRREQLLPRRRPMNAFLARIRWARSGTWDRRTRRRNVASWTWWPVSRCPFSCLTLLKSLEWSPVCEIEVPVQQPAHICFCNRLDRFGRT